MSVNILNAIALANDIGCTTIAFVGFDGGTVGAIARHVLHIPSNSYQHIEDVHLLLCHVITNALQERARRDESLASEATSDAFEERTRKISYAMQQLRAERSHANRLRMIPDQMSRTIGFDATMVFEVHGNELRFVAGHNTRDGEAPITLTEDYYETEAVRDGVSMTVMSTDDPRVPAGHPAYGKLRSYAIAPIVDHDQTIALLVGGYTSEHRAVTPRDASLLRVFAYSVREALGITPPAAADEQPDPGWWAVS
jgi:GAF domain-containing protein